MARRLITVCFVGVLWWSTSAQSQSVPVGYKQVASEYGLPPALLYSVALTESGQSSLSEGQFRPWPWALNIDGEGHYFSSRQLAWHALQAALTEASSVDVGLMQISWRYHRASLGSSWQALDPYHNLRVAAAILRDCFVGHTHWIQSAGCYHAPNDPARADRYGQRVKAHWMRLTDAPQEVHLEYQ
ncbi:MAG: lytic transglycosylase [Halioglobus sp.]|nr:lytic transglycosylase [Halioglobus sp.]|tara:strand:+ start:2185 stop:2742 length:558 start_codon:yes stop_codon:yes gene_type:complete